MQYINEIGWNREGGIKCNIPGKGFSFRYPNSKQGLGKVCDCFLKSSGRPPERKMCRYFISGIN